MTVIQALDVDSRAAGPNGRDRPENKALPSDLTDEEWERIAPVMPAPGCRGQPREVEFRDVMNAVRYVVSSGCGWRMLPVHFGHWRSVYGWFCELARRFLFQTIHDVKLMLDRERTGREATPTAAVIDSQSIKASQAEIRGYNAGKKIVGRKRHIAVDTDGRLMMVNPTAAGISDSAGAQGFKVLPRRKVVQRTFGWMIRWRRLARDYEHHIDVSIAMIFVAMGANLTRRNTHH